jgi:hypothetical protein
LQVDVDANGDRHERPRSAETTTWWFGLRDQLLVPHTPRAPADPARGLVDNSSRLSTEDMNGIEQAAPLKPVARPRPYFGKRLFAPVYQWEGVVEEVNGKGFRARLHPFERGEADPTKVEYADFEYDDLADDSDHALVVEGAVFYWTVGRHRNEAGTQMNTSLVRFRRLPPPNVRQIREAEAEAEALLADLRADK